MLSRTLPDIPKTDPRESEYLWDTATAHTWHTQRTRDAVRAGAIVGLVRQGRPYVA